MAQKVASVEHPLAEGYVFCDPIDTKSVLYETPLLTPLKVERWALFVICFGLNFRTTLHDFEQSPCNIHSKVVHYFLFSLDFSLPNKRKTYPLQISVLLLLQCTYFTILHQSRRQPSGHFVRRSVLSTSLGCLNQ